MTQKLTRNILKQIVREEANKLRNERLNEAKKRNSTITLKKGKLKQLVSECIVEVLAENKR